LKTLHAHLTSQQKIEQAILIAMAKEREARYADIATFLISFQKTTQQWLDEGDSLYDLKRYEEALAAYEQAIRLDPNFLYRFFLA
jgi:tetratricopeptide (TPR) repeat protein